MSQSPKGRAVCSPGEGQVLGRQVDRSTVAELLDGSGIDMPQVRGANVTSREAPRAANRQARQSKLEV